MRLIVKPYFRGGPKNGFYAEMLDNALYSTLLYHCDTRQFESRSRTARLLQTYQIQFNFRVTMFVRPNIQRCRSNLIDQGNGKAESR
jgi:hypothetical protein